MRRCRSGSIARHAVVRPVAGLIAAALALSACAGPSPSPATSVEPSVAHATAGGSRPSSPSTAQRVLSDPHVENVPQEKTKPVDHCAGNTAPKAIRVSISAQHAWMCAGAATVRDTPVTTGADKPDLRTPTGTWAIQGKQRERYLGGDGYEVHVHYWMPYNVDFGFHDAGWQTFPFGSAKWRTGGSHGCVHLPTPMMAWVYDWADVGTPVTVAA